ncbi:MAG: hypothetical protein RSE04_06035 [Hydrogenoanaerobacterium sp.]
MKLGIDVDITLKADNSYLNVPVIPASISYADGDTTPVTVSILQLGDVDFHNGVSLDAISWSCFFPARYDAGYCKSSNVLTPTTYRDKLSGWKDSGKKVQVIIPSAGINKTMKISSFKWEFKGFEGDLYYEITLKEHKEVKPIKVAAKKIVIQTARTPLAASGGGISKGDKVKFNGGPVYRSSSQANPTVQRGAAMCNCTIANSAQHPYHLIHYSGDIVYGWVNASDCEKM